MDDAWNVVVANQTSAAAWTGNAQTPEDAKKISVAGVSVLVGMQPADEIEGMLLAQMVAAHNASMECHRRAMIPDQTVDSRGMNLSQANKLSRTHTMLVEALTRYRSRGEQRIVVQHVNVEAGGQAAIAGVIETGSNRGGSKIRGLSHDATNALAVSELP